MASYQPRTNYGSLLYNHGTARYFIITITNHPNFVLRREEYETPNQVIYVNSLFCDSPFPPPPPPPPHLLLLLLLFQGPFGPLRGPAFIPGIPIHIGTAQTDEHERLLYNTVRCRIEEIIREYLQRTQRPYPFHLIFDLSELRPLL